MHTWHAAHGARFINAGLWVRPQLYPRAGESDEACIEREARQVRSHAGMVDVSTLGKIELQGPDVAQFLNRVYVNNWHTLAVGRARYGVMLREDGFVFDDGTTSRLAEQHYLMTTTTANAEAVLRHLEFLLQIVWPDLRVRLASVTEQWAALALAGPNSRAALQKVADVDLPFLGVCTCQVAGIPARVLRISYSGELAYEIHVPADRGQEVWEALSNLGVAPYGTEAMGVLRIEKGHIVVGAEADGRTTADDLGLGALVAKKYCIGKRLLERPAHLAEDRWQLVGLTAVEGGRSLPRGAKLLRDRKAPMEGHITSWCYSPHLEAPIALALLAGGRRRDGEVLWASSPVTGQSARVRIGPPCFFDPEGARLRV
jgi:glycine cleavage system aminomethyltransferase T